MKVKPVKLVKVCILRSGVIVILTIAQRGHTKSHRVDFVNLFIRLQEIRRVYLKLSCLKNLEGLSFRHAKLKFSLGYLYQPLEPRIPVLGYASGSARTDKNATFRGVLPGIAGIATDLPFGKRLPNHHARLPEGRNDPIKPEVKERLRRKILRRLEYRMHLTIAVHAGMRAVLRHFNHPAAHRQQITGLLVD